MIVAAAATAVFAGSASASLFTELTVNGDFETGDFTGYVQFPTGPGQQNVVSTNPSSGTFAGEIVNDATLSNSLIKQEKIGIGMVSPGDTLRVRFDARGSYAQPGGVAFAEFFSEIDPVGGGTSAAEILGGGPLAIDPDPSVWTSFEFLVTAGPDVDGGVTLQLGATNGPAAGTTMYYDNLSVQVIPEPGTMAFLGTAGLGLLARRRRA
ncbi:MAG: PEP-CTERM sorting domain-containing protein [Planctomycetota bacterium]